MIVDAKVVLGRGGFTGLPHPMNSHSDRLQFPFTQEARALEDFRPKFSQKLCNPKVNLYVV